MMSLGRERPPSTTTNAQTKVFNREIRYRKATTQQSYDNRPKLRGVTMKKRGGDELRSQFGNDADLEIHVFPYVFSFKLCIGQDQRTAWAYTSQNTNICALLACLAQPTYLIPARCGTDTAGRGAFEPSPEDGARTKRFDRIPVPRVPY